MNISDPLEKDIIHVVHSRGSGHKVTLVAKFVDVDRSECLLGVLEILYDKVQIFLHRLVGRLQIRIGSDIRQSHTVVTRHRSGTEKLEHLEMQQAPQPSGLSHDHLLFP